MALRETIEMRLKLSRERQFARGTDRAARSIDNLGDQAAQASGKMQGLSKSSSATRVNIGPLSTDIRTAVVAMGGMIMVADKLIPLLLSTGKAAATLGLAGVSVGMVGMTTMAQGVGTLTLGLKDLKDAIGGDEEAIARLGPKAIVLAYTLQQAQKKLQDSARDGLMPGLAKGTDQAMKNFPILEKLVFRTARTLGSLAKQGGTMLGSKAWGKDMKTVGGTNVKIIRNLGKAALSLADGARHIVAEAAPLTEWLSIQARRGASLLTKWIGDKRERGEIARFFRIAKADLQHLGVAAGHLGRGILNIFGQREANGRQMLGGLEALTARFERWTETIKQGKLSEAIRKELIDGFVGLAGIIVTNLTAAATTGAGAFWSAFKEASFGGKAAIAAALAFKFRSLIFGSGKGGLLGAAKSAIGKTKPIPVFVTNPGGIPGKGGKGPGGGIVSKGAKLGTKALPLVTRVGGISAVAAGAWWLASKTHQNNFDTKGPEHAKREEQGRPSRSNQQGALQRVPDPVVNTTSSTHVTVNVDGERVYSATQHRERVRRARRRARVTSPRPFGFVGQ